MYPIRLSLLTLRTTELDNIILKMLEDLSLIEFCEKKICYHTKISMLFTEARH